MYFILRAVPIVPSVVISVFCGFNRFDQEIFSNNLFRNPDKVVTTWFYRLTIWQSVSTAAEEISYLEEFGLAVIILVVAVSDIRRNLKNKIIIY